LLDKIEILIKLKKREVKNVKKFLPICRLFIGCKPTYKGLKRNAET